MQMDLMDWFLQKVPITLEILKQSQGQSSYERPSRPSKTPMMEVRMIKQQRVLLSCGELGVVRVCWRWSKRGEKVAKAAWRWPAIRLRLLAQARRPRKKIDIAQTATKEQHRKKRSGTQSNARSVLARAANRRHNCHHALN